MFNLGYMHELGHGMKQVQLGSTILCLTIMSLKSHTRCTICLRVQMQSKIWVIEVNKHYSVIEVSQLLIHGTNGSAHHTSESALESLLKKPYSPTNLSFRGNKHGSLFLSTSCSSVVKLLGLHLELLKPRSLDVWSYFWLDISYQPSDINLSLIRTSTWPSVSTTWPQRRAQTPRFRSLWPSPSWASSSPSRTGNRWPRSPSAQSGKPESSSTGTCTCWRCSSECSEFCFSFVGRGWGRRRHRLPRRRRQLGQNRVPRQLSESATQTLLWKSSFADLKMRKFAFWVSSEKKNYVRCLLGRNCVFCFVCDNAMLSFFDRNFLMPTSNALEDRNSERRYFTLFWVVFGKTKNTERLWC